METRPGVHDGQYLVHGSIAFNPAQPDQPLHLPAYAFPLAPGKWITSDPFGGALLVWRVEDVFKEWDRYGLRGAILKPFAQTGPSSFSHAFWIAILMMLAVPFLLVTKALSPSAHSDHESRSGYAKAIIRYILATGLLVLGIALLRQVTRFFIWGAGNANFHETHAQQFFVIVSAHGACMAIGLSAAIVLREISSIRASFVGHRTEGIRIPRTLWGLVLVGCFLETTCLFGPFLPLPAFKSAVLIPSFNIGWFALTIGGLLVGYFTVLSQAREARRHNRFLWTILAGGFLLIFWVLRSDQLMSFHRFALLTQSFLGGVTGVALALTVSPRVLLRFDEWRSKRIERVRSARVGSPILGFYEALPQPFDCGWLWWPFSRSRPAKDQRLKNLIVLRAGVVWGSIFGVLCTLPFYSVGNWSAKFRGFLMVALGFAALLQLSQLVWERRRFHLANYSVDQRERELRHSGMGVWSLILAIVAPLFLVVTIASSRQYEGDVKKYSYAISLIISLLLGGLAKVLGGISAKDTRRNGITGELGYILSMLFFFALVAIPVAVAVVGPLILSRR